MGELCHSAGEDEEVEGGDLGDRLTIKHQVGQFSVANQKPKRHDCLLLPHLRAGQPGLPLDRYIRGRCWRGGSQ